MLLNYSCCKELLVDCIIHSCVPLLCNALLAPKDQWMKWNAPSLQHLCADTESVRLQNFRYIVSDNYWIVVTISINAGWEGRQCFFLPGRFWSDITVKHISEYSRQCSANILNIQCTQYDPKTCSTVCVQILLTCTHSTQNLAAVKWASCIETSIRSQKAFFVWFKSRKMNSCSKNLWRWKISGQALAWSPVL